MISPMNQLAVAYSVQAMTKDGAEIGKVLANLKDLPASIRKGLNFARDAVSLVRVAKKPNPYFWFSDDQIAEHILRQARDKQNPAYYAVRKACPKCKAPASQVFSLYRTRSVDFHAAECRCGWKGIVHELVA